jgi:predicted nucleotide-binding protein (sugar kinase/HSP70/actin superfamily)
MDTRSRIIVGGISQVHDALIAAALRRRGLAVATLGRVNGGSLARGRTLLPRGTPNPALYLAGALVEHALGAAARDDLTPSEWACGAVFVTVAGRFGHHGAEYRRALTTAGLGALRVIALPLDGPRAPSLDGIGLRLDGRTLLGLARAAIAGDVLVRTGCVMRPQVRDPSVVDGRIEECVATLERALEQGLPVTPHLAALGRQLRHLRRRRSVVPRVRVRIVGEFFPTLTDGDGGYGIARWLEERGAVVEPPTVAEWLLYLCWQQAEARPRARREEAALRRLFAATATAAGLPRPRLPDMDDLAALAAPYYAPQLRGGSGHLEVALFRAVERDDLADLVVSVKPFASVTSSAISDALLHALSRRSRVGFVSIETTGDAEAQIESRLELARDQAGAGLP